MLNMRKSLKYIDWISLVVSCLSMMLMFLTPDPLISKVLLFAAGLVGIGYLGYAAFLWFFKRVDFDWHLINGHFLRKVIILVISMPSTITMIMTCISTYSPESKELVFDNNLYKQSIEPQIDKIKTEETICVNDSVFITNFSSYYTNDIDKTLPDSIKTKQEDPPVFWTVYYHFIDPGNQHMTTTPSGRVWASLIAILGVFLLNGLLVSSIIGWIDSRKEKWQNGSLRYKLKHLGRNKFAVIIGANEIAASVIQNLLTPKKKGELNFHSEGDNKYVILQTSRDVQEVRNELESRLSEDHLKKVIIYKALRDSKGELKKLHIEYATEVYILGETSLIDGGESYHDAINMKCVNIVAHILNDVKRQGDWHRKVCKVLFEYQTTYSIFLFSDVSEEINKNLVFIPFNRCESWARRVMAGGGFCKCAGDKVNSLNNVYMPLDGDGIKKDSDDHVHFIVVGMSKMGIAMGVQALLQAHYINYAAAEKEGILEKMRMRRTRLTFIDSNADKEKNFFIGRYQNLFNIVRHRYIDTTIGQNNNLEWDDPMWHENLPWSHLNTTKDGQIKKGNFLDIEIEFVKGELESENVRKYLLDISNSEDEWVKNSKLTIAICLTQTHQAIAASLYMPISVYEKAQQVWVYQPDAEDIISNLKNTNQADKRYKKLRAFGMVDRDYMSNRSLYLKSILVNAMYDLSDGNKFKGFDVKDIDMGVKDKYKEIREMWKKLSIDKKFSNKYFADTIMQKIRSIIVEPFTLEDLKEAINCEENKEILARCEHNRWNVQQLLLGYSPCPQNVDSEFQSLEMNKGTDSARQKRNEIRERFAQEIYNCEWADLNPFQRQELTKADSSLCKDGECENMEICKKYAKYRDEYYKTPYGIFDKVKEDYKTGENRMHANICSYDHLDVVDSGAKGYDATLNSKISMFIEKVDLYTPSEEKKKIVS